MKLLESKSWRTTSLGIFAIMIGLRSWYLVWIPNQSFTFNLFYVGTGPLALILLGIGLVHARDHKHRRPPQ